MGNYTILQMFENPRRGRQATKFTTNVPKILDLKSSSEQILSENCRWVPLKYDLSSNQHTEKVMKYKKRLRKSHSHCHSHLCPSSLKQMNFKMERFSGLLVTITTEMIIFNIQLSIITKLNHEIQEQWHLAPMLVYDSIHP